MALAVLVFFPAVISLRPVQRALVRMLPALTARDCLRGEHPPKAILTLFLDHPDPDIVLDCYRQLRARELRLNLRKTSLCCELFSERLGRGSFSREIEALLLRQSVAVNLQLLSEICADSEMLCKVCRGLPERLVNNESLFVRAGALVGLLSVSDAGGQDALRFFETRLRAPERGPTPRSKLMEVEREFNRLMKDGYELALAMGNVDPEVQERVESRGEIDLPFLVHAWLAMESGMPLELPIGLSPTDESSWGLNETVREQITAICARNHERAKAQR